MRTYFGGMAVSGNYKQMPYFDAQELAVLNQQTYCNQPMVDSLAKPVMVSRTGMPQYPMSYKSRAKDEEIGVSCDEILQEDADEILKYFHTNNTRPQVYFTVRVYHTETTHGTDSEGRRTTSSRDVTDMEYNVDITRFIFPFGFIHSEDKQGKRIPQIVDEYIHDDSGIKQIKMIKQVDFDLNALRKMIKHRVQNLVRRNQHVTVMQHTLCGEVRIFKPSTMNKLWNNCFTNFLCHITIIPCIVYRIMQSGHNNTSIKSTFRIPYSTFDVYKFIHREIRGTRPCGRGCRIA